ncbi:MAG TPA: aminoglycoside phosphotransferase family protein [Actinoplanes sp.]|jgi:aminoglycoside phosphotransferase (APT) family kinase protein
MIAADRTAVEWAETVWQRRVREARTLPGGWTSTTLGLTAMDGERAVLRLMTREPWRSHAPDMLAREAAVQRQLAPGSVPAPVSIALDPDGSRAGTPAHLMSWLPGTLDLDRADGALVDGLAALLLLIHHHDPGPDRPRAYQSWAHPAKRMVPTWSARPELWERAFEELRGPVPAYTGTFLHRDFHLGNVLWVGGQVTGVVDWVETSWGPAGLDVAHAATYLAMLHGGDAAEMFVEAYRRRTDAALDGDGQRHWNLMDIVGYLPDPSKVAQPWRDVGRAVSDELARARLEQRLAAVLQPPTAN